MTGKERREMIRILVSSSRSISAKELAGRFNVTRMTIHRDLKTLEESGYLSKIHGGAIAASTPQTSAHQLHCSSCNKPTLPHQRYLKQKTKQNSQTYCCASCGLKAQLNNDKPGPFWATDLISGKQIDATEAYFLIRSSAAPCCQPSILSFADENEAATFRSSFGGVLARLGETLDFLRTEAALREAH